jgi:hypothetical protein
VTTECPPSGLDGRADTARVRWADAERVAMSSALPPPPPPPHDHAAHALRIVCYSLAAVYGVAAIWALVRIVMLERAAAKWTQQKLFHYLALGICASVFLVPRGAAGYTGRAGGAALWASRAPAAAIIAAPSAQPASLSLALRQTGAPSTSTAR